MNAPAAGAAVVLLLATALLLVRAGPAPAPPRGGAPAAAPPPSPERVRALARRVQRLRRARRARQPPGPDLAQLLELTAAAAAAGLPPGRALQRAVESLPGPVPAELARVCAQLDGGGDPERAWEGVDPRWRPLAEPLLLSARTGASTASLLVSAAAQHRAERRRAAAEAAARLGSQLVLPLGLCTLPSFLLLGVVPVVLTLARDVLTG
ncbi:type II secretion system F family protein [Kineococcus sp. SYSU DK018]|uniref:type II secretion system F family protein n=1 Tax=Kineococcus sp. SYSU DK018 TaxID=3383139 RepID=UPI003D7CBF76